ncbi:MAG: peptidylprolyl isomerase, partial [Candidatus Latescibacterota bacterium]
LTSHSFGKTNNTDKVVLEISNIYLSEYIFEKKLNKNLSKYKSSQKVSPDSLRIWIERIKDDMYFLEEAYNQGLDKSQKVNDTVTILNRTFVTQERGLLYNKIVLGNIHIDEKDTFEAYTKSSKTVTYEYLLFRNSSDILKTIGDKTSFNENDFIKLIDETKNNCLVKYSRGGGLWPFWSDFYIADYLYLHNEKTISEPINTPNGIYIVHIITTKSEEPIKPYKEMESSIKSRLEICKELKLSKEYENTIKNKASALIDDTIVDEFYNICMDNDLYHDLNTSYFKNILKDILATYRIDSQKIDITVENLLHFYNDELLIKRAINKKNYICDLLDEMIYQEYAYRDAVALGITSDPLFQMDTLNLRNSEIMDLYDKNLLSNYQTNDQEIEKGYNKYKEKFVIPDSVIVNMYIFDSREEAQTARMDIRKYDNDKEIKVSKKMISDNISEIVFDKKISYTDTVFSKKIRDNIFRIPKNALAGPYKINNQFVVFKRTGEEGKTYYPLKDIKAQITYLVKQEKIQQLKKEILPELKKKYQLIDLIDHKKYIKMAQDSTAVQNNPGRKSDSSGTNVMNKSATHSPAIKGSADRAIR